MYLEDEHIMSDLDGVRKRGTMLQTLVYDIYTGFQQKMNTLVVALDIKDAHNRVDCLTLTAGSV